MAKFFGEKSKTNNQTKQSFHFVNDEKKINQLSREIYKKVDKIIHYPIGYNGGQKYNNITSLEFNGFKSKLPTGIIKSYKRGYGFTKNLKLFANYLDNELKIKKIIFERTQSDLIDLRKSEVQFSDASFSKINKIFSDLAKKSIQEQELASKTCLHNLFPKQVSKPEKKYVSNALTTTLSNWGNSIDEFSQKDKQTIQDLFEKLSLNTSFLDTSKLSNTKQYIDNKILTDAIAEFSDLMNSPISVIRLEKNGKHILKQTVGYFRQYLLNL